MYSTLRADFAKSAVTLIQPSVFCPLWKQLDTADHNGNMLSHCGRLLPLSAIEKTCPRWYRGKGKIRAERTVADTDLTRKTCKKLA